VREVEVEVLPSQGGSPPPHSGHGPADPLAALLARLMDSLFAIPGTKIRVGLDPLLGLIPVLGSPISALVSVIMLARSARQGVPNFILARMAANVILNALLDELPVVGDFLSVFFRSNKINYELMQKYAGTKRAHSALDRVFIWALVGAVALFVICAVVGLATLTYRIGHWIMN
jgi:hypothetical protein